MNANASIAASNNDVGSMETVPYDSCPLPLGRSAFSHEKIVSTVVW